MQTQRKQKTSGDGFERQIEGKRNECLLDTVVKGDGKGSDFLKNTAGILSKNIELYEMPKNGPEEMKLFVQTNEFAIWNRKVANKS